MAVGNNNQIEKRLWDAADELRANSKLKSSEYSIPVLGLIFLRYADQKFAAAQKELEGKGTGRRQIGKSDYQAKGVLYLPETARFQKLLQKPEGANIGQAINDAMRAIEGVNPDLKDVLPKTYNRLENSSLVELLKIMASIPMDIEGDAFGKIYEYFLGKFAMAEGQKGGEFFTPTAIVKLIGRYWSRFMAASSTLPVGQAVCSSRALGSSGNTRKIPRLKSAFTAKSVCQKPSASIR